VVLKLSDLTTVGKNFKGLVPDAVVMRELDIPG
jgi:hypothetical protein